MKHAQSRGLQIIKLAAAHSPQQGQHRPGEEDEADGGKEQEDQHGVRIAMPER